MSPVGPVSVRRAASRTDHLGELLLATCVALVACEGSPTSVVVAPIVDGTREVGFPEVVLVARMDGTRIVGVCTGTVLAPDRVLTAKHCLFEEDADGSFREIPLAETRVMVTHNPFDTIEQEAAITRVNTTPGVFTREDYDAGRDVALLVLDRELSDVTPRGYARASPNLGDEITLVGFGGTGIAGAGRKFLGTATVSDLYIDLFETNGPAGTCVGDSGGPAIDVDGRVVGVVSFGPSTDCSAPTTYYSELAAHVAWIDAELTPPCVATPEVCNGLDDDCNELIDDGCDDAGTCGDCDGGTCGDCDGGTCGDCDDGPTDASTRDAEADAATCDGCDAGTEDASAASDAGPPGDRRARDDGCGVTGTGTHSAALWCVVLVLVGRMRRRSR